jgi:hypothetical protein
VIFRGFHEKIAVHYSSRFFAPNFAGIIFDAWTVMYQKTGPLEVDFKFLFVAEVTSKKNKQKMSVQKTKSESNETRITFFNYNLI